MYKILTPFPNNRQPADSFALGSRYQLRTHSRVCATRHVTSLTHTPEPRQLTRVWAPSASICIWVRLTRLPTPGQQVLSVCARIETRLLTPGLHSGFILCASTKRECGLPSIVHSPSAEPTSSRRFEFAAIPWHHRCLFVTQAAAWLSAQCP